jgi:hypothetical protein
MIFVGEDKRHTQGCFKTTLRHTKLPPYLQQQILDKTKKLGPTSFSRMSIDLASFIRHVSLPKCQ